MTDDDHHFYTNPATAAPPLGVEPQCLWREQRARDLASAIGRYAQPDERGMVHIESDCVREWIVELEEHLAWLRGTRKPSPSDLAKKLSPQ